MASARRPGTANATTTVHATCVAVGAAGVLIRGRSASGKSDLALRLIDDGGRLVADDRVVLERRGATVTASAPASLAGLLEVRGLGIVRLTNRRRATVRLVVDLADADTLPRMPERTTCTLLGVPLRRIALDARQASATAKLRLALGRRDAESWSDP